MKSHDTEDQEVLIAWDDVSGVRLNPALVKEARKAEMEYFRKMGANKKVSKKRCYDVTGKAPIGVRSVGVNKQDDASRLVHSNSVAGTLASVGESGGKQKSKRRWTMEAYGERREPRILLCAKPQTHVRRNLSRRLRAWR